jgi:hypothetical protein
LCEKYDALSFFVDRAVEYQKACEKSVLGTIFTLPLEVNLTVPGGDETLLKVDIDFTGPVDVNLPIDIEPKLPTEDEIKSRSYRKIPRQETDSISAPDSEIQSKPKADMISTPDSEIPTLKADMISTPDSEIPTLKADVISTPDSEIPSTPETM